MPHKLYPNRPCAYPTPIYDGDMREGSIGRVYAVGDNEYYVPHRVVVDNQWTKKLEARVAKAEKVDRPVEGDRHHSVFAQYTSKRLFARMDFRVKQLSEISSSTEVSDRVRKALMRMVAEYETPKPVKPRSTPHPC